ncbi:MAG: beta-lactamase family protein [Ardenticatenales bacterium]|nr:beta-lactamase family protein [Ardenticatenales bacterium]
MNLIAEKQHAVEQNLVANAIIVEGLSQGPFTLAERMAHHKVPGLSVAVINEGRIEWAKGYGVLEGDNEEPVTTDTLFQAASISKPVAALGALLLVEAGKLGLDEDVNTYLRGWRVPDSEHSAESKVTLRTLLTHTAGLTVHGFRGYAADEEVPSTLQVLDGLAPANSDPVRVDVPPGTLNRYSGGGYTVLQQLIEDVSGQPFAEFMRENVLAPLGMESSGYEQPRATNLAATGHREDGSPIVGRWHRYPEMAAAGLWTTPSDLARFAIEIQRSLAGESNKVLSSEMTQQMLTAHLSNWGLGPEVGGEGDTRRFLHGGSNEGFRCYFTAYCSNGQGLVAMTNSDSGSPLIMEVMRSVAEVYGWPDMRPVRKTRAAANPHLYLTFVGTYHLADPELDIAITSEGERLFVQVLPGPRRPELHPESELGYFVVDSGATVQFQPANEGAVQALSITFGEGGTFRAERVAENGEKNG